MRARVAPVPLLHDTKRPEQAADLTAETFARAIEVIAKHGPTHGQADQGLVGVARHIHSESYRPGRVESAARERLGFPPLVLDDHAAEVVSPLGHGETAWRWVSSPTLNARRSRHALRDRE